MKSWLLAFGKAVLIFVSYLMLITVVISIFHYVLTYLSTLGWGILISLLIVALIAVSIKED